MLKRENVLRALAVTAVLLALASQALAAWGGNDTGGKPDRQAIAAAIAKKLDLTPGQIAAFKAEEQDRLKTVEADRQKIKELGDKLKEELAKDSPDKNVVHDLITQIGARMTDMRIARTDSLLKMRESLTPEQKTKFKEMLIERSGKIRARLGGNRH